MLAFDVIMTISFSIAIILGSLTFYHIKNADKISSVAHNLQWKLFIAVCAQTFVPTLFVYIPYFFIINFPFFGIPLYYVDDAWMRMTACFPAWDAVIIILLISDYRNGLVSLFRKKKTVQTEVTWKAVSSIAPSTINSSAVVEDLPRPH
ncbi:hypothetical protein PRIPAC_78070 [Pristionchus pacificus]|uniref:G protein-coupled receptor n=1 Tax=Pristionchus pacificus TaxID=54126 RepID=A0A454XN93_PRIPA|nr:hypothetical protein PRIPAC_78070 [Pristionchus pacificus]|eukprot:PDM72818.1 G protein-coupled receptor [Pristionchus pacificus]